MLSARGRDPSTDLVTSHPSINPLDPASWPEICPDCGVRLWKTRQCLGHHNEWRGGGHCGNSARNGATHCSSHGGKAPQVQAKAQRRLEEDSARRAVVVLGLDESEEIAPDPHTALLEEVHRAARWIAGIELCIADIERQSLVRGVTKTVELPDGGRRVEAEVALNVWVEWYHRERDRLVRACKEALAAGVSERLVRLEEEKGRMIAELFGRVRDDPELGLSEEQRHTMGVVAARELRALPGGHAA